MTARSNVMTRALILTSGIALLACSWLVGVRSGYERGAFDAGQTGYTDGYTAGWNASLRACVVWGSFPSGRVVICERRK